MWGPYQARPVDNFVYSSGSPLGRLVSSPNHPKRAERPTEFAPLRSFSCERRMTRSGPTKALKPLLRMAALRLMFAI